MKGYEFIKCNHPSNIKRGGVGLYINDTLPKKERPDIAILPECIVCELHFDRKKYFFVVLYRSPNQDKAEFDNFMNDLIFTDQSNLFIESGIHPSLHEQCHHQIVHCRLSIRNLAPPSYTRKLWFYDRADLLSIRKSVAVFRWKETFEEVTLPDEQVEILKEVLLNICSNFIPNQLKKIKPRQIP